MQLVGLLLQLGDAAYAEQSAAVMGLGAESAARLPYPRNQELEADRLGMITMARAGYDPAAAIALWLRMAAARPSERQVAFPRDPSVTGGPDRPTPRLPRRGHSGRRSTRTSGEGRPRQGDDEARRWCRPIERAGPAVRCRTLRRRESTSRPRRRFAEGAWTVGCGSMPPAAAFGPGAEEQAGTEPKQRLRPFSGSARAQACPVP